MHFLDTVINLVNPASNIFLHT